MANVLAEYRLEAGGSWLIVIGAPEETYLELAEAMRRNWNAVDVRPRDISQPGAETSPAAAAAQ